MAVIFLEESKKAEVGCKCYQTGKKEMIMRLNPCSRGMVLILLFVFCCTVLPAPAIHAGMLQTGTVFENGSGDVRDRINSMLEKQDVQRALENRGISVTEARERVAALSDAQLQHVAGHMDSMPSGQGIGSVVGAIVFIFLVLLITDIIGLTNVFPFVVDRR
jgi:hypothetical protein